jgi:hypothetical protein
VYRYATTGDGGSMLPPGSVERVFGGPADGVAEA